MIPEDRDENETDSRCSIFLGGLPVAGRTTVVTLHTFSLQSMKVRKAIGVDACLFSYVVEEGDELCHFTVYSAEGRKALHALKAKKSGLISALLNTIPSHTSNSGMGEMIPHFHGDEGVFVRPGIDYGRRRKALFVICPHAPYSKRIGEGDDEAMKRRQRSLHGLFNEGKSMRR